jgi:hypothetical protein
MTVLVILASIVGKVGGATISARILNNSWRYDPRHHTRNTAHATPHTHHRTRHTAHTAHTHVRLVDVADEKAKKSGNR